MRKALRAKFYQHPQLTAELLATRDAMIVEHTANDTYWADGGNGEGKNMLGILLMELRQEAIEYAPHNVVFPPWIAFPWADSKDMFWRMGWEEEYLDRWQQYLETVKLVDYRLKFPEPDYWEGAYTV